MSKESKEVREPLERDLAEAQERRNELAARWSKEKEQLERVKEITRKIDELRGEAEREERGGNLQRVAEIRYGELPALEQRARGARERGRLRAHGQGGGRRGRRRRGRRALDRDPGRPAARGRDREADPHGGAPARARRRPGRGRRGGRERPAPRALRAAGPEPPDRLLRLPRANGCRQDRARPRARGVHVRRRARARPARHERVHGEAHRLAARRRSAGLRRLRRRRAADRGGAAPALLGRPPRRDREGAPRRLQRPPADPRRRPPDRRPGPDGRLPQHRPDHDLEHPLGRVDARALPARVPEPDRRDRRVRAADEGADRRDRRAAAASCRGAARRARARARADGRREGARWPRPAGTRPTAPARSSARSSACSRTRSRYDSSKATSPRATRSAPTRTTWSWSSRRLERPSTRPPDGPQGRTRSRCRRRCRTRLGRSAR